MIALQDWADRDQCLFLGLHGPASDKDYQYFVAKEMGSSNGIYHICDCDASRCKVRNTRGDRRELIHIDKWRLQTPLTMVESPYLTGLGVQLGEKTLSQAAREKKARGAPLRSGLDQVALEGADPGEGAPEIGRRSTPRGPEKERSRSPLKGESSRARYLTRRGEKQGEKQMTEKKKKKESVEKKEEKQKKESSSSSSEKSESSSDQACSRRDDSPLSRAEGGSRRRDEVAESEEPCLSEPDFNRDPSSSQERSADSSVAPDTVSEHRSPLVRTGGKSGQHAGPVSESLRNVAGGWTLGYGTPFRDRTSQHRCPSQIRGDGAGRQARASNPQAEGVLDDDYKRGRRQRARPRGGGPGVTPRQYPQ